MRTPSINLVAVAVSSVTLGFLWGYAVHLGEYGNQFGPVIIVLLALSLAIIGAALYARRKPAGVA